MLVWEISVWVIEEVWTWKVLGAGAILLYALEGLFKGSGEVIFVLSGMSWALEIDRLCKCPL